MTVQQTLLQNLGNEIAKKLQEGIAYANVSGETSRSIHAVSEPFAVTVFGAQHLGALEYGRKPSEKGSKPGKLFDIILQWVKARGILFDDGIKNSKYTNQERTAKTITYFIHKKGTALFYKTDHYGHTKPSMVIQNVLDQINMNSLLKDLTALQINEYSSEVIRELKKLE